MSKTLAPSVTSRDPKGSKFMSVVEAAYNKARLSHDEAQRVNETPGLSEVIAQFVAQARWPNKFCCEEVASNYGYSSGYKIRGITEQVHILRTIGFPDLSANEKISELPLPAGAEGWFAIPKWQRLAGTYGEAVEKVLAAIKRTRNGKFANYCSEALGPEYLRQSALTSLGLGMIEEEQKGYNVLVVPAQFGYSHGGHSIRRSLEVMGDYEFGLGAFAVGIMLLTHPERFSSHNDLCIDCSGDELAPLADSQFVMAPCFELGDDLTVSFCGRYTNDADGVFGSVSGFLPG